MSKTKQTFEEAWREDEDGMKAAVAFETKS